MSLATRESAGLGMMLLTGMGAAQGTRAPIPCLRTTTNIVFFTVWLPYSGLGGGPCAFAHSQPPVVLPARGSISLCQALAQPDLVAKPFFVFFLAGAFHFLREASDSRSDQVSNRKPMCEDCCPVA